MALKVTFDTNVFKRFIDFDKRIQYETILNSIQNKSIIGYFSDTFITLEGVMRHERVRVFGSRKISSLSSASSESPNTINISIGASMCKPNLHDDHLSTVTSLINIGLNGLRGQAYLV